jgi:hypothetical protein
MPRSRATRRGLTRALTVTALGSSLLAPASALATGSGCQDPSLTLTPTGSMGDDRVAAVTAQTLEAGVEGWADVSWRIEPGAGVHTMLVHTTAVDGDRGVVARSGLVTEGRATGVRALTFCGSEGSAPDEG